MYLKRKKSHPLKSGFAELGGKKSPPNLPLLNTHLQVNISATCQDFIKCFSYSLCRHNRMTVSPVIQPSSIKLRINLKGGRAKEEGKT